MTPTPRTTGSVAATIASLAALAVLAGCAAATPSTTSPSAAAAPTSTRAPTSVAPVDLASDPGFCEDMQTLIDAGDAYGTSAASLADTTDLDHIHGVGADLAALYAKETAAYVKLGSSPDPRIAADAKAVLAVLPEADGARAQLAQDATDLDQFTADYADIVNGPIFTELTSPAHVASDEMWDIAYATCGSLAG